MGHTNSTANLALPQFIGTDKPTWLGDINGAFSAIDSYAGTNDAAVAAAVSDASSAISQASAAVNTANTANTTAGNASTTANNAIGVANTANAIAGTVDAKVGLLADLNTTDRTSIVNAINEVNAKDAEIATITADGIKTFKQICEELHTHIADITINSKLVFAGQIYSITNLSANAAEFNATKVRSGGLVGSTVNVRASGEWLDMAANGTVTDNSNTVVTSGLVFKLYK